MELAQADRRKEYVRRIMPYLALYAALFLLSAVSKPFEGDDLILIDAVKGLNLFEWIAQRYANWSSRLFSEGMVYLIFGVCRWLWYVLNPAMMLLLGYSLVRILTVQVRFQHVLLAVLVLHLFYGSFYSSGVLWMTGAIYYLWPAAIGAFAMRPFADAAFRQKQPKSPGMAALYSALLFCAAMGTEQIAACLLGFAVCVVGYLAVKTRKVPYVLLVMTLCIAAGVAVFLLCPGNNVRYISDMNAYDPGFEQNGILFQVARATLWMFEMVFTDCSLFVFAISAGLLLWAFRAKDNQKNKLFAVARAVFLCLFLVALAARLQNLVVMDNNMVSWLHSFKRMADHLDGRGLAVFALPAGELLRSLVPYVFWTAYAASMACLLLFYKSKRVFYGITMLAAVASLLIMAASPTLYVSGARLGFVCAVLLALVLLDQLKELALWDKKVTLLVTGVFALVNMASLYGNYLNGYYVIY